ncbi:MAG: electron transfer flavoprotein subunit beta/FixA family protein [Bacteroidales bacterium]|nr:electron transfer flavoprotein subunit beta/FixA family protein [Bacteroidales bacterium]
MSLNIIVLAKQVPDTRNVGKDAMKEDGTVNRAALPAIFNPEDLNALEQALRLKEANPGSTITLLTMGLPRAAEMVREAMWRGADGGIVLTDPALGGADTLATSYSLAQAVKKFGNYDIILGGRQAIDGDTAQVGPQIAEKLGIPQVTYAEEILDLKDGFVTVKRRLEHGVETVKSPLPCVVTVNGSAAECRPRNAVRVQRYKYASLPVEQEKMSERVKEVVAKRPELTIKKWSAADVEADPAQIGFAGSPTKVKAIEAVVFTAKESLRLDDNDEQIEALVKDLIANHTIG